MLLIMASLKPMNLREWNKSAAVRNYSINILSPGVCVEFTNGDKGLVVTANDSNVLEPFVLSFNDNKLYNLADSKVAEQMKIKDIMKTMDNRHVVDREFLSQYMGKTLHMGEK